MSDKDISKIIAIVYGIMYAVAYVTFRILKRPPKKHKKDK